MIDVELDIGVVWGNKDFGQREVEKAVDAAVRFATIPELADPVVPVSVSIKLSDNAEVHALNKQWRDKDKPTNVLSFPMLDDEELDALITSTYDAPEIMLGDIILAYETCAAEAAEKGISIAHHATHLVIHGMLHLLGHDHIEEDEAELMEALEVKALASMGLHNPYNDEIDH
ncbi:rRNA maturation RNase YbeY [Sphingorhabdus sp. EL138]|uniref:rRNA maturation RNase YbeY n=1 Tax=Sphingorhabdus sp. EL138 TaxID=2073156 RepID=UPI0025DA0F10|nr:rRNA maturation RNase YbeY [Sphingorhabdus sp. EL138]